MNCFAILDTCKNNQAGRVSCLQCSVRDKLQNKANFLCTFNGETHRLHVKYKYVPFCKRRQLERVAVMHTGLVGLCTHTFHVICC